MKNLITIFAACMITINTIPMVSGQTFQKTFGGFGNEKANSIQQTLDGGFIITGGTENFAPTAPDVYLIKTDANGDTMWTKTFGGDSIDEGWSVQQTADGGYIIAGNTQSFGAASESVYLIKTDAIGNILWSKIYGGCCPQSAYSVQQTSDNGYIIVGETTSFGAGSSDVYLIKTNSIGDTLWTRTFGETGYDIGSSVQQTIDGGYIIGGFTCSFGIGCDAYLIKTDFNGNKLWANIYGGIQGETGNSVQQTSDSGYVIVGSTNSFGQGVEEVFLIKTNSIGDTLWTRTFGGVNTLWTRTFGGVIDKLKEFHFTIRYGNAGSVSDRA